MYSRNRNGMTRRVSFEITRDSTLSAVCMNIRFGGE